MEGSVKQLNYWHSRIDKQRFQNRRLAQRARIELEAIITLLTHEFGAKQIILFGSLASGRFGPGSDIDLAVAGIAPDNYFVALAAVNRLTRLWVDLKPLEALEPHFRQGVLKTGEILYARDDS